MKCSLKDGFINILLLFFITPTKGIEFPLFLHKSSVLAKPMNTRQCRPPINRLQDLDSFPGNGENRLHRIVKKQMATCDYKGERKSKRSVPNLPQTSLGVSDGAGDFKRKEDVKAEHPALNCATQLTPANSNMTDGGSFLKKIKDFARDKDLLFKKRTTAKNEPAGNREGISQVKLDIQRKEKEVEDMFRKLKDKLTGVTGITTDKQKEKVDQDEEDECPLDENTYLSKAFTRFPDNQDYRCYYECESHPNGCLKLRHKRCPQGQFFSFKYLKCLKVRRHMRKSRFKKNTEGRKKIDLPESSQSPNGNDDQEPANEWLDATQGTNQKIPSEFKPKKKPALKIYHIRGKRKLHERLRSDINDDSRLWGGFRSSRDRKPTTEKAVHGIVKKQENRHHSPRSYVIHINKKEGSDQITDNDENEKDNDEDDEETDEEDEDEEADDEDDDSEEEDTKEVVAEERHTSKDSLRELLKSAKAAVTNRARFEEPVEFAGRSLALPKPTTSSLKSKKSNDSTSKDKKVLIDASIKVDSTISSVLRNFLKSKGKEKEGNNGLVDGYETLTSLRSRDEMNALYEHLMQNNPRVKRYFLANCIRKGN